MSTGLIRRVLMKIDKNYLPYEHFGKIELFKETEVIKGVTLTRMPSKHGIYFKSIMKKGVKIVEHYHNSFEYFYIIRGKILINNKVTLEAGDEFSFDPYEMHKVKVIEECELFAQLVKNENKK